MKKIYEELPLWIYIVFNFIVLACVCLMLYHYSGTTEFAEREISEAQKFNARAADRACKIASSTDAIAKRVQTGIKRIAKAKKRIESVTRNASEAITIIEECESILKEIETQE